MRASAPVTLTAGIAAILGGLAQELAGVEVADTFVGRLPSPRTKVRTGRCCRSSRSTKRGTSPLLLAEVQRTPDELAPVPTKVVASVLGESAPLRGALELARRHARENL